MPDLRRSATAPHLPHKATRKYGAGEPFVTFLRFVFSRTEATRWRATTRRRGERRRTRTRRAAERISDHRQVRSSGARWTPSLKFCISFSLRHHLVGIGSPLVVFAARMSRSFWRARKLATARPSETEKAPFPDESRSITCRCAVGPPPAPPPPPPPLPPPPLLPPPTALPPPPRRGSSAAAAAALARAPARRGGRRSATPPTPARRRRRRSRPPCTAAPPRARGAATRPGRLPPTSRRGGASATPTTRHPRRGLHSRGGGGGGRGGGGGMAAAAVVAAAARPAAAAATGAAGACWGRRRRRRASRRRRRCSDARGGSPVAGPVPGGAEAAAVAGRAPPVQRGAPGLARLRRELLRDVGGRSRRRGLVVDARQRWVRDARRREPHAACSACARRREPPAAAPCQPTRPTCLGRFENRRAPIQPLARRCQPCASAGRTAPRRADFQNWAPVKPSSPPHVERRQVGLEAPKLISRMAFCNSSKDMPFPARPERQRDAVLSDTDSIVAKTAKKLQAPAPFRVALSDF